MKGEIRKVKITRKVLISLLALGYNVLIFSRPDDPVRLYRPTRKSTMELLNDVLAAYGSDAGYEEEIIYLRGVIKQNVPVVGVCIFDDMVN